MPGVKLIRTAALATAVLAGVLPAAAGAATLSVDKSCYREASKAVATGAGFSPNTQITFSLDGAPFTDATNPPTSDATGNLTATFEVGSPKKRGKLVGQKQYTMAASDGQNTAQTTFTATRLDVTIRPRRGNPGRSKRVRGRGFDRGKVLRYHVRGPRRRNGKVGKVKGACGKVNKKARIFRATYPSGIYTVQFDQSKAYRASTSPRVVFEVRITRRVRSSLVSSSLGQLGEAWTRIR